MNPSGLIQRTALCPKNAPPSRPNTSITPFDRNQVLYKRNDKETSLPRKYTHLQRGPLIATLLSVPNTEMPPVLRLESMNALVDLRHPPVNLPQERGGRRGRRVRS